MASALTAASLVNARKRVCPKCGRQQSVSVFAAQLAVTCRRCGASIPPSAGPDGKPATGKPATGKPATGKPATGKR